MVTVAAAAIAGAAQQPIKQTSRVVVGEYPIIELYTHSRGNTYIDRLRHVSNHHII